MHITPFKKQKNMSKKIFDLCVFGASGFTGTLVAQYLSTHADTQKLSWALAGRNKQKLQQVLEQLSGTSKPELVVADVGDFDSLLAMTEKSKVVITTVGPYTLYGEPLVRACIENKTHYVDLTGEPNFVDVIRYKYHQAAVDAKVKIINACGFDSIPHDLGVLYCVNQLGKNVAQDNQKYMQIHCEGFVRTNARFSGGTWHSAIAAMSSMIAHRKKQQEWKREGYSGKENIAAGRKVRLSGLVPTWSRAFSRVALPMPTIDPQIVARSAQLRTDYGVRFTYAHYLLLEKGWYILVLPFGISAVFLLAQFRRGRERLAKVIQPGDGPSQATRDNSWFSVDFFAESGAQKLRARVSGGDPGYTETSKMLAESALCLALNEGKLPPFYGITTTAAALGEHLIERLQTAGICFEVVDD